MTRIRIEVELDDLVGDGQITANDSEESVKKLRELVEFCEKK